MRKLGQELGVDAMALYRHVRDKDDLLDGIIESSSARSSDRGPARHWKTALREQVMAARQVMLRHPWARRVLEERGTAGPRSLDYIEAVLAIAPRRRLLARPRPPRAARRWAAGSSGSTRTCSTTRGAAASPRPTPPRSARWPPASRASPSSRCRSSHEGGLGALRRRRRVRVRARPDPRRPRAAPRLIRLPAAP